MDDATPWTCALCEEPHDGLALVFGSDEPYPWQVASEAERAAGELTADTCVLPTLLHTREPGTTPWIELNTEIDHPLVAEWRDGITRHRVAEINRLLVG